MDPTLYVNGYLQVTWGIGKNENYYLENSSLILKQIIAKMNIQLENTVYLRHISRWLSFYNYYGDIS